jgi:GDP-L-fucose synthase
MHFIFDLIRKILRGKLFGEPVVLWGDGYQRRELVFVDDFVTTMLQLNETVDNDLVNIGSGEEHTIREFASAICDIVGFDFKDIQFDESRYVGARSKVLDVGKLRRLIPDLTQTPLADGLEATVRWFQREGGLTPASLVSGR